MTKHTNTTDAVSHAGNIIITCIAHPKSNIWLIMKAPIPAAQRPLFIREAAQIAVGAKQSPMLSREIIGKSSHYTAGDGVYI